MRRTPVNAPVTASEPAPNTLALTIPEVAWVLRISPNMVRSLITTGSLPSFNVGRRRLIARSAVELFISHGGTSHSDDGAQIVEEAADDPEGTAS